MSLAPAHRDEVLMASLDELESAPRYAAWILDLISPYVHGDILEAGAGRGTYSPALAAHGHVTAVEPSVAGFAVLAERLAGLDGATAVHGTLDDGLHHGPFDTVVLLNVLEHIADDRRAVTGISATLRPGGHLVLWVPAFELLYGEFDHAIGHHRRYRRAGLQRLVEGAGLEVVECRYRNLPGWFAWLVVVRILHRRPTASVLARCFDHWIVPIVRLVERHIPMPLGQSLLLVARRP